MNIQDGIVLTGETAKIAAPIVAMYNPAAGAALAVLAPVVERFLLSETQMLIELRQNMTREQVAEALRNSTSDHWGFKPLEVPEK